MNRIGTGIAVVALLTASACGGGGGDEPKEKPASTTATPAPKATGMIDWASTCPAVQDALDAAFAGDDGQSPNEDYARFADSIQALTEGASAAEAEKLVAVVAASLGVANERPKTDWYDAMDELAATCRVLGHPLD